MQFSKYQNAKSLLNLPRIWKLMGFDELLKDVTKTGTKIPSADYEEEGLYPVIDQGKGLIAGYSSLPNPIKGQKIIFGDHTRSLKFIDFDNFHIGADGVKVLENKKPLEVITKYIYLYLSSVEIPNTGYNRHYKYLKEIVIPIPNIETQNQIIEMFDNLYGVINKRQSQITALDELTQSLFLEMFGDPIANTRKWDLVELAEVAEIKIGPFGSLLHKEDYILGGHPLVNPSHIAEGKIKYDINLTISTEKYIELSPYNLKIGDLVLGRRGEMGRCAVVKEEGLLCGTGSMIIRSKGNIHPEIMQKIISFPSYKKTIEDKAVGQTMPNLNVPIVSKLLIPMIPESVQMDYFEMLNKIEKNKELFKRSLKSMQDLYNSLLQKAFKGELFQEQ